MFNLGIIVIEVRDKIIDTFTVIYLKDCIFRKGAVYAFNLCKEVNIHREGREKGITTENALWNFCVNNYFLGEITRTLKYQCKFMVVIQFCFILPVCAYPIIVKSLSVTKHLNDSTLCCSLLNTHCPLNNQSVASLGK